jgi:hypothetical protein
LICIAADVGASALVKEAWGWLQASALEVHVTAANAYLSALIKDVSDVQVSRDTFFLRRTFRSLQTSFTSTLLLVANSQGLT